ncbi:hypothetical protein CPB84DRAFT_1844985 [Gymnopilus junonius]|uniref:HAM1-like N-terminal domain-containing protein n=1 Tax=Gymnopilus junonius TaxID=109634 RepID=A0A9P5NUD0_GYMJU|nr:hypothetical protein CPB84DRAFT_1844985 [Gymnopilus junonius]
MDKMRAFRDEIPDRIPHQHKDKASDTYNRTMTFLSEEYFPEERRDQFIFRGKKECQKHDDYQNSVRWFFGYLRIDITENRTLFERIANGQYLLPLMLSLTTDNANRDEASTTLACLLALVSAIHTTATNFLQRRLQALVPSALPTPLAAPSARHFAFTKARITSMAQLVASSCARPIEAQEAATSCAESDMGGWDTLLLRKLHTTSMTLALLRFWMTPPSTTADFSGYSIITAVNVLVIAGTLIISAVPFGEPS